MRRKKNEKKQPGRLLSNELVRGGWQWMVSQPNYQILLSFAKQMLDSLHNMHAWALVLI